MSKVDRETVIAVARLSRLAVSDEDITAYQAHFERLLTFVNDLTEAPLDDVCPMAHPLDLNQRQRPDLVFEDDRREALQQSAPQAQEGYYLVPRVIE